VIEKQEQPPIILLGAVLVSIEGETLPFWAKK
jgi:hypothetical protein